MEPLFFSPFFEEKPWGGQRLRRLYGKYPIGVNIGECWELSATLYRQTFVKGGEYAGIMLSELYRKHRDLFGTETKYFPFVIKFIDADAWLPVIVGGGGLKRDDNQSKAIVVLRAEPGADLVAGIRTTGSLELFNAIAAETLEQELIHVPVSAGDAFFVPPGAPHAIGKGLLVYTISSPLIESTNLYDWGRHGQMEMDKIVDAFRFGEVLPKLVPEEVGPGRRILLRGPLFQLERIDAADVDQEDRAVERFRAYTALSIGQISYEKGEKNYKAGDTFIVPAGLGDYRLSGGLLLKVSVEPSR